MLFSSNNFIFVFLPVSLVGYQVLSYFGRTAVLTWLSLISLFFYAYWNPSYLLLLGASILANFLFSQTLGRGRPERNQTFWLVFAIVVNLLALGYYKYLFHLCNLFYTHGLLPHPFANVVLPLGISFFTFTQIAYLIDLRQDVATRQNLLGYSVFVTFFPHLIAGPIIHPREIMPQLDSIRGGLRRNDIAIGMSWFVMGLGKKVLIADRVAPLADMLYAHPVSFGFIPAWIGCLTYAMQLYFDFSGYSDMALGLARMFSITFPLNFNSPYKAANIIDFWQCWHMTLTRYLFEYLYTPVVRVINGRRLDAGKKVSRKAQATPGGFTEIVFYPLMTTMLIAGVWHGAGMQYVLFGLLHGFYLVINHAWRLFTPNGHRLHAKLPHPLSVLLTFSAVLTGQVLFRANNVKDASYVLGTLVGMHGMGNDLSRISYLHEVPSSSSFMVHTASSSVALAICFFIVWALPNTQEFLGQLDKESVRSKTIFPSLIWQPNMMWSLTLTVLLCSSILLLDASTRFLYFQF